MIPLFLVDLIWPDGPFYVNAEPFFGLLAVQEPVSLVFLSPQARKPNGGTELVLNTVFRDFLGDLSLSASYPFGQKPRTLGDQRQCMVMNS
jgi:hypothetical protein